MRWRKKRPLWPVLIGLGCLFVAAPRNWHSPGDPAPIHKIGTKQPESVRSHKNPSSLPELDSQQIVQPRFDTDSLLRMSRLFSDIWEGALEQAPGATTIGHGVRRGVRVESSNDRLAMLDVRPQALDDSACDFRPIILSDNLTTFADQLLDAARGDGATAVAEVVPDAPEEPQQPQQAQPASPVLIPLPPVAQLQLPPVAWVPPTTGPPLPPQGTHSEEPTPAPPLLRHKPTVLIEQLSRISAQPEASPWCDELLSELELLTGSGSATLGEASAILDRLSEQVSAGRARLGDIADPEAYFATSQALSGVERRLAIWRALLDPTFPPVGVQKRSEESSVEAEDTMVELLTDAFALLAQGENGETWRDYLMLDRLAAASSRGTSFDTKGRRKLAQKILARLDNPRLNDTQRRFLSSAELLELRRELRIWATGPVDLETLAGIVERYERSQQARYAAALLQVEQRLRYSDDPQHHRLAQHLEQHFRGANMRIALSKALLNRMMPEQKAVVAPVRDRIAGAKVRGRSKTTTDLEVQLIPDPQSWNFALKASGKVQSYTRSDTWPARTRNAAHFKYEARKEVELDDNGLTILPAEATARGRNDLVGVESQLDPIPVLGFLLRDAARQKHQRKRPLALSQVKSKVANKAEERMNSEADAKLKTLEQKFRDRVMTPFDQLAVLAETTQRFTTSERAVMQLRLANPSQLAAHTPRPAAPSDSYASMQMHQTALNNAVTGLGLEGRRMKVVQLYSFLAARLGYSDPVPPEDLPARAIIEFAPYDAVRVFCEDDCLKLVLGIREVAHKFDKIRNFQVHATFRPEVNGLNVRLVRDGVLHFEGKRLKTGPRVVLHSVFGKLLHKGQEIVLLRIPEQPDPRLNGLMITQLIIDDGWIALALGPDRAQQAFRGARGSAESKPMLVR